MGMGEGCRVVVDDGSGRLEVWVPTKTDRFGDVHLGSAVQLQIVRAGGTPKEAEIRHMQQAANDALRRGDMAAAQRAGIELITSFDPKVAEATATSVRRARR
jgi:hypothetical protein